MHTHKKSILAAALGLIGSAAFLTGTIARAAEAPGRTFHTARNHPDASDDNDGSPDRPNRRGIAIITYIQWLGSWLDEYPYYEELAEVTGE